MRKQKSKQILNNRRKRVADPNVEAILGLIGAVLVPIASSLYQVSVQQRRDLLVDRRAVRRNISNIREAVETAQFVLEYVEKLVRSEDLSQKSIRLVGTNNIELSSDEIHRYFDMHDEIIRALQRVDNACMDLSSLSNPSGRDSEWIAELHRLQQLLNTILLAETYREKTRTLRWAIRVSNSLLKQVERAFQ
jgi:hypothetical protein